MKRIVAFALTLAMLVTLLPVAVFAQDAENGVTLKPFYNVAYGANKTDVEGLDYVYPMITTWADGTVVDGIPTISVIGYGTDLETITTKLKKLSPLVIWHC